MTKPRFLADENVPRPVVRALREATYDVIEATHATQRSLSDDRLLLRAARNGRILLTNDTDFLRTRDLRTSILLFRMGRTPPDQVGVALLRALRAPLPGRPVILVLTPSGVFALQPPFPPHT